MPSLTDAKQIRPDIDLIARQTAAHDELLRKVLYELEQLRVTQEKTAIRLRNLERRVAR